MPLHEAAPCRIMERNRASRRSAAGAGPGAVDARASPEPRGDGAQGGGRRTISGADVRRRKPTVEEVRAAEGKRLPDVLGPGLDVVFCGINPGLYSAAVGCHFARPGNRFWNALHAAGFSDRLLSPFEQTELLEYGCGLTNLVARATTVAAALTDEELRRGRGILRRKIGRHGPRCVAILGIGAYRKAFERPGAGLGAQDEDFAGSLLWVLPNPSGLNAHYQPPDLARLFGELRAALGGSRRRPPRRRGKR